MEEVPIDQFKKRFDFEITTDSPNSKDQFLKTMHGFFFWIVVSAESKEIDQMYDFGKALAKDYENMSAEEFKVLLLMTSKKLKGYKSMDKTEIFEKYAEENK